MASSEKSEALPRFVDAFELQWFARAVRRHVVLVVLGVMLGAVSGLYFHYSGKSWYRAEALLQVNVQLYKIGLDDQFKEIGLVKPTRRLVGSVCESGYVMQQVSDRLGQAYLEMYEKEHPQDAAKQTNAIEVPTRFSLAGLKRKCYFDQRTLEMIALQVVDYNPDVAALIANTWAQVSSEVLREAYGTSLEELNDIETSITEARRRVQALESELSRLAPDATAEQRAQVVFDLELAREVLDALNKRYALYQVRLQDSTQVVRVVAPAVPTDASVKPAASLIVGLFTFAGLLLGVAAALLRGPGRV